MSIKSSKKKSWGYGELSKIYAETENKKLGERLLAILDFANERSSMMVSKNHYPSFGLKGKNGKRIISFWSPERHHVSPPGSIHLFITLKRYKSKEERDLLVEKLNNMFCFGYDLYNIEGSRTSEKSISDISEEEFSIFMQVLEDFSK